MTLAGTVAYAGGARVPAGPCAPAARRDLSRRLASVPADGDAAPPHAPPRSSPLPTRARCLRSFRCATSVEVTRRSERTTWARRRVGWRFGGAW